MASRLMAAGACALALVAQPSPGTAQRMLGQMVTTHAYLGGIRLDNLYLFEGGTAVEQLSGMLLGGQAGFGITPSLSVLGNVATNSTTLYLGAESGVTFGDAFRHDVLLWDVNLQIRRPFWHEKTFNPVLQIGAGQIRTTTAPGFDPDQRDERVAPALNAGLGFDLQFGNAFGVRIMAKDYYTTLTWESTADPRYNFTAAETTSHNLAYHVGITLGF